MISRYAYHGGVWVDMEDPTEDDVHEIAREFGVNERLEMELFTPTPTPLVASDVDVTLLVLHFPTDGDSESEIHDQEVDFVIGKSFIITVRYEVVAPLHRLQKVFETQKLIAPKDAMKTDVLLEILFTHIFTAVRDHTSHIADRLGHIEHDMFNGLERVTVRLISNISREFLHIEASLANQEEPLIRFLKVLNTRGIFGASFAERSERILAERAQVSRVVATYRAIATELRETNASLLEARQNEIMKTLTVITFIALPLQLITFVFGMHALGAPLEDNPNAFWIILSAMIATGSLVTFFLVRKRWIS